MSNNKVKPGIIFDPLDDLCFQSYTPYSKKERFYLPLVFRFHKSTGRLPLCTPRKRKLHGWSRKDSKLKNAVEIHAERYKPLRLHLNK